MHCRYYIRTNLYFHLSLSLSFPTAGKQVTLTVKSDPTIQQADEAKGQLRQRLTPPPLPSRSSMKSSVSMTSLVVNKSPKKPERTGSGAGAITGPQPPNVSVVVALISRCDGWIRYVIVRIR